MPLIDLQTNLKDLKYGDFGVEDPLITKDINNPPSPSGIAMEVTRRIDDLSRITKLLVTPPGIKHIANQTALNIVEKNIQGKNKDKTIAGRFLRGGWSSIKGIASTVAQVPVNGTGTHFVEGFGGKRGYLPKVQGHRSSLNGEEINLQGIFEDKEERFAKRGDLLTKFDTVGTVHNRDKAPKKGELKKEEDLFKDYYAPGVDPEIPPSPPLDGFNYNERAQRLYNQNTLGFNPHNGPTVIGDTSKQKGKPTYEQLATDRITAKFPKRGKIDTVEALDTKKVEEETTKIFKDLIDFNFKIVKPQSSKETLPTVTVLDFRAYLDAFNDSFNGEWSSFKYVGRGEDFHNYTGFSRSVQFSFKVAASSIDEMRPLYSKLNKLAGVTAPTYTGKNYMRGNIATVTIGDYLINEPGIIETVTFNWQTDYNWHTSTHDQKSKASSFEPVEDVLALPQILDVTISFKPINTSAPTFGTTFIGKKNQLVNSDGN